ncbi:mechanosensitive ion channel family protein [Paracrocinitomix mangrovi]|uniref:mechanosensitive ion channel family protein n=1 Tax=Paracrocinitomix mangrovi TaxID=2862509 RepID=UPI001C8E8D30|nr:mechanosensitive ion channel domain-containing protein [Paracrocinitomix mangrovi]UKN01282.1 mechanosensitive ion channel family protein [Paracrocinitomix mangrovi]
MIQEDLLDSSDIPKNKLDIDSAEILHWCNETLRDWGLSGDSLIYTRTILLVIITVGVSFLLWWLTRNILLSIIHRFAEKTKTKWDDELVNNKFFSALAHLVPLLFMDYFIRIVFHSFPRIATFGVKLTDLAIIIVINIVIIRFLNTTKDVLSQKESLKDKPLESFSQLGKIIVTILLVFIMISVAFNVDLLVILTSMGAMTAVILLVFKDTILGFVGSIQLAANDMVRIGDWVTMEKYGADGDVMEITLNTVKVKNFDLTITTIPTYSFISDSFKNWRGMQESGGRRVVRSLNIQLSSIKFCTPELLDKLGEIELIKDYVEKKEQEIEQFNANNKVNKKVLLNGRNQTNIGIFRYYVTQYLKNNPEINQNMTLMVRQLQPTEQGVALQVYCFTKTKVWDEYEQVISHIFDHLMASVKYFDLRIFENPSGEDFKRIAN